MTFTKFFLWLDRKGCNRRVLSSEGSGYAGVEITAPNGQKWRVSGPFDREVPLEDLIGVCTRFQCGTP